MVFNTMELAFCWELNIDREKLKNREACSPWGRKESDSC